jgi:hypothetical protein
MGKQNITDRKCDHPGYPSKGKSSMSSYHQGGTFKRTKRIMEDPAEKHKRNIIHEYRSRM